MHRYLCALLIASVPGYGQLFQSLGTSPLGANTVYTIADFNLDGRPDLARGFLGTGKLSVSLGATDGGFIPSPDPPSDIDTPTALLTGDFDNDGKTDLVVLTSALFSNPTVRIMLGSGTGTFAPRPALILSALSRASAVGDFDQDGNLDIVIITTTSSGAATISLLRGNGKGDLSLAFLTAPVPLPVPAGSVFGDIRAVDLNGDNRLDLVLTVSHSSGVGLATGIGDGRGSFTTTATMGNQPPLLRPAPRLAVADFNGDRNPDVVMFGYQRDQVTLWLNSGGALVPQVSSSGFFGANPYAIAAGDFDLDGRMDFALTRASELHIALGSSGSIFNSASGSPFSYGGPVPLLEVADLNGDRRPDLLVVEGNSDEFRYLLNIVPRPPTLLSQTIQFSPLADRGLNDGPLTLTASSNSGLPVTFAGLTNSICTVNKGVVTMVAIGNCTVLAIQQGDLTYSPAPFVQRGFQVVRSIQTITFAALPDRTLDTPTFAVSATASSGLTVSFTAGPSSVCTLSGTTVTLVAVGQCTVTASQLGNSLFPAATPVVRTFSVSAAIPVNPRIESIGNAASYAVGTLAPASYAVLFGVRLTGATLKLRDSGGLVYSPEIIFAGPAQINFIVPPTAAKGTATVSVTAPNGVAEFPVTIATTAPGLFSSNGSGQGLAAAQAIIVNADKSVTTVTVADGPIFVRAGTEIYLVLYGTGIRGHGPTGVFASVAGSQVEVLYAGAQGTFPALDQINVRVPLTVAGLGNVEIKLVVDGLSANTVLATFQ